MDCRPVCKRESLQKVITKALYTPFMEKIQARPMSIWSGYEGGGAQITMAIRLLMEANLDWVLIALNIKNTFTKIMQHSLVLHL